MEPDEVLAGFFGLLIGVLFTFIINSIYWENKLDNIKKEAVELNYAEWEMVKDPPKAEFEFQWKNQN